jgi:hypothetical protein
MTGAIEFLRKAKEICKERDKACYDDDNDDKCPMLEFCCDPVADCEPSDLVRKVMDYEIPEDEFDGKAEYEEAMKQDFDICEVCEDNQITECVYLENDDRKSCPKVMAYEIKEVVDAKKN